MAGGERPRCPPGGQQLRGEIRSWLEVMGSGKFPATLSPNLGDVGGQRKLKSCSLVQFRADPIVSKRLLFLI